MGVATREHVLFTITWVERVGGSSHWGTDGTKHRIGGVGGGWAGVATGEHVSFTVTGFPRERDLLQEEAKEKEGIPGSRESVG